MPEEHGTGQVLKPPPTLVWTLRLGIAAAVVAVLSVIVGWVSVSDAEKDEIFRESQRTNPNSNITRDQVDSIINVAMGVFLVIILVLSALWLLGLFKAYQGRNWGRVLTAILGGIWLLLTVLSLTGSSIGGAGTGATGALDIVFAVLQLLLLIGTLVTLFMPQTSQYFASQNRSK